MKTIIGIDEKYDRNNERRRNKRRNEVGVYFLYSTIKHGNTN